MDSSSSNSVANSARYYAWGRQDESGGECNRDQGDRFASMFAAACDAFEAGRANQLVPLAVAWSNFITIGQVYGARSCGLCGRPARIAPSGYRRCVRCEPAGTFETVSAAVAGADKP